jgi:hypothetical protein
MILELSNKAQSKEIIVWYFSEILLDAWVESKTIVNVLEKNWSEEALYEATAIKVNEWW